MTTEDDFQSALDADPSDWQTRLVFADWLQERDDPRAEGYRFLGIHRRCPEVSAYGNEHGWNRWTQTPNEHDLWKKEGSPFCLPLDLYRAAGGSDTRPWHETRREAEDAAALAFAKLPAARRAELLAAQPTGA